MVMILTQFWEDWSADEVWPGVWIGNKGAAIKVVKIIIIVIVINIIIIIIVNVII